MTESQRFHRRFQLKLQCMYLHFLLDPVPAYICHLSPQCRGDNPLQVKSIWPNLLRIRSKEVTSHWAEFHPCARNDKINLYDLFNFCGTLAYYDTSVENGTVKIFFITVF